jgi:hypothetical protein
MISEESKQDIYKKIMAEVQELDLPYPSDFMGLILGKMVMLIEEKHQIDTLNLIEQKMAELEQKMEEKHGKRR